MLVFEERGTPEYPEKNLSEQSSEPINKHNPHMMPGLGIEPRTHWWEASALTTAPSLLPCFDQHVLLIKFLLIVNAASSLTF